MKKIIYCLLLFTSQTFFAQDTLLVPMQDVLTEFKCYSLVKPREAILITNQVDAKAKLKPCDVKSYRDTLVVNFTTNNIIFYNFNTGGSVLQLTNNLYKIPSQKKYIFVVKVQNDFTEAAVLVSRHIIYLTPKLDTTYTFEYKKMETSIPMPQSFIDKK